MIDRRSFLGLAASAGASLAASPELLRALREHSPSTPQARNLLMRAIPSTGERLPVVGLTLANHALCADREALKEVVKAMYDSGGRVLDTYHGNTNADQVTASIATELGINTKVFWSARMAPPGAPPDGAEVARSHLEATITRYGVQKMDLAMLNVGSPASHFEAMRAAKREGRVRYIGISIFDEVLFAQAEALMRSEAIDFIGVRYSVDYRHAEKTLLPLAMEKRIGVISYFPFGGNGGMSCVASGIGLFARVGNTPLPEWAAEFDATSWAQFFIKYIASHPAITVIRGGTTKAKHMVDNMGGGVGRLPDEAMRRRMTAVIDAMPEPKPPIPESAKPGIALSVAVLERYVGTYKSQSGFTAVFRRDGDRLFVKPGNNPEVPLNARTETRLQDPRGPVFEFQLDASGKVTGAVLEQGAQKIQLVRQ